MSSGATMAGAIRAPMRRTIESCGAALALTLVAGGALGVFLAGSAWNGSGTVPFRWVTYGNTALAGSTTMYAVYLWLRAESIGRAATVLAATGAVGVLCGLALGVLRADGSVGLYEGTALFSAVAVLAYLAMERAYGNRSAGIVVMPAVMIAVLCEMWLIVQGLAATGRSPEGLGVYWDAGHRFAMFLGYCPLAAAALLAVLALLGKRHRATVAPNAVMLAAISVGAPLLVLGAGMGAIWLISDRSASTGAAAHMAVLAAIAACALAARLRLRGAEDPRLAWHAIGVFLTCTAGLLLAASISGARS